MFCILLANLRKWVKIPYNLLSVNEDFEGKRNTEIYFLVTPLRTRCLRQQCFHKVFKSTKLTRV